MTLCRHLDAAGLAEGGDGGAILELLVSTRASIAPPTASIAAGPGLAIERPRAIGSASSARGDDPGGAEAPR